MQNPYPGINPHLNSRLQQQGGGWRGFHAAHLADLYTYLDEHLPQGYVVELEKSLQFGIYDDDEPSAPIVTDRTDADVLISRSGQGQPSGAMVADLPVLTLAFPDTIPDEDLPSAIIIKNREMQPITRIELLSPANKPGGSHAATYREKRAETLAAGLRLVEIDYLHERSPILSEVPDYSRGSTNAYPYTIVISDPLHPGGKIDVYAWSVADRLPVIPVPLAEEDIYLLAFTPLYNRTAARRSYLPTVDYSELPEKFDSYQERDQQFIHEMMAEIATQ